MSALALAYNFQYSPKEQGPILFQQLLFQTIILPLFQQHELECLARFLSARESVATKESPIDCHCHEQEQVQDCGIRMCKIV